MRVIVAHHLADDLGALGVGAGRAEAQLVHRVEHAAVHGLQAVAHVGQRAPDDHRHRVVEVRGAHLLLERARLDVAAADHVSAWPSVHLLYTSRFATARALSSMKARRGSTWSPISIEKMRSAAAASSSVTCASVRVGGVHRRFAELLGVHLAEALEALQLDALLRDASSRPRAAPRRRARVSRASPRRTSKAGVPASSIS